ncbi:hypothetical protein [Falsiroseomonas sp.]|uniref:hypothetical protein n=1 Tax=Falsiroseomonas sp. TaxID=2870721 RepID=UPI003F72A5CB
MKTLKTCLLLALLGSAGAVAAGTYYVLSAFSLASNMGFVPQMAFATVAGYRVFQAHSLPLPVFTSGTDAEGPPCFTAGVPRQGLAAGSSCRFPSWVTGAPAPLACSIWKGEVCNVIALPAALYRDAVFLAAIEGYANDPCRFVDDYRQLQLTAVALPTAHLRYYAQVIDFDFGCAALDGDQPRASHSSNIWSRLKPYLLLKNDSQTDTLLEFRIRTPGARRG